MGNVFTARGVDARVSMSNGTTAVFCDVLALAGSATAGTPWQKRLILHFCDSERHGSGVSGIDLLDLPWTRHHRAEQDFFLHVLDRAAARHGWERLHYDPPLVRDVLLDFRRMLESSAPRAVTGSWTGDWTSPPRAHEVDRCVRHLVFPGRYGCRLCDVACQPVDAPRVWELVSERTGADGRVADRRVVQVPDAALPALRRWFDLDPGDDGTAPRTLRGVGPGERGRVEAVLGTVLDPGLEHRLRPAVA